METKRPRGRPGDPKNKGRVPINFALPPDLHEAFMRLKAHHEKRAGLPVTAQAIHLAIYQAGVEAMR